MTLEKALSDITNIRSGSEGLLGSQWVAFESASGWLRFEGVRDTDRIIRLVRSLQAELG